MSVDWTKAAEFLLEIPAALLTVKKLLPEIKDEKVQEDVENQLNRLKEVIMQYASMHYALGEWKELHDHLQSIEHSLENVDLEINNPEDTIRWEMVKILWKSFSLDALSKLQSFGQELKYIGTEIDLTSAIHPTRRVDWTREIQSKTAMIHQELRRQDKDVAKLREYSADFTEFIRDLMIAVNAALRKLASDLSDASKKLEGALKGIDSQE